MFERRQQTSSSRAGIAGVHWSRVEWPILAVAACLLGIGMVFIQTMSEADLRYDRQEVSWESHLRKIIVSMPGMLLAFLVRPRWLRRYAGLLYSASLVLLALVPFVGQVRNDARRWIQLPLGFDLQPSELAKLGLILGLAGLLYRRRLQSSQEWGAPLLLTALPMILVAAQPDLGTALTMVPVALGMFYLAGASGRVLTSLVCVGALLGLGAWKLELGVLDYQLKRIDVWASTFEPEDLILNQKRGAFHAFQARVAIGNGGLHGTGLGRGITNQTGHLPERESDSIFAVIAEEGGLVSGGVVILLYTLLVCLIMISAASIRERFSRLVVGGVGLFFMAHYFINMSVNMGLMPFTGLTLPLISTGGSSMLVSTAAIGLILGQVARHEPSLGEDSFRF